MPLYPYRCTQCGYRFEKIQSFSSPPEVECPECKGALERLLTVPGLQFKGTGWYVNDYVSRDSTIAKDPHGAEAKSTASESGEAAPATAGALPKNGSKAATGTASESKSADSSAKSSKAS